jgi:hypothetical protein
MLLHGSDPVKRNIRIQRLTLVPHCLRKRCGGNGSARGDGDEPDRLLAQRDIGDALEIGVFLKVAVDLRHHSDNLPAL